MYARKHSFVRKGIAYEMLICWFGFFRTKQDTQNEMKCNQDNITDNLFMEWYAPLTILPAIGLIILSTSNFIISLNTEIIQLENDTAKNIEIIRAKLKQLKRLGIANGLLYGSGIIFLAAGLFKAMILSDHWFNIMMVCAAFCTTLALIFLFIHSLKSIQIRQKHLKL